ncbi:MAG: nitroreductase family protein [Chloroflexota bacterium]
MSVYDLATRRRTIRRFQDIPVPWEVLERCVNTARLAPSASNLQPLEYIVVDDPKVLPQVFSAVTGWARHIRPRGNPPPGKEPRAYIVVLKAKETVSAFSVHDIGMAAENIILVALEEGVGSCTLASIDREKLRALLKVPEKYEIPLVLALGYPDESPVEEPFTDYKYWKDEKGILHVPKKKLESILHRNVF